MVYVQEGYIYMTKIKLHDYQRYAIDYIKSRKFSGLFLDMGLGKTVITLTALSELGQEGLLNGHVLIIAPKKIAMNTWPSEIEKWEHTRNAKYTVLSGLTKKKRDIELKQVFKKPAQFYFVNPELTKALVQMFGKHWPFKTVIIDEVQTFKSYSSQRFKALKTVRPYINRVVALTGTPAPNSLMDLWPQITLLDGGRRLGRNISMYRDTFFNPGRRTPEGFPYEWLLKPDAEEAIYNKIDDIVISMKAQDYLNVPSITFNNVEVTMTSSERKVYQEMKKEKVLPLVDGTTITSKNAATLSAHLLQLANGAIYMDSVSKNIAELHKQKIEALEQIIDSSQGSPILVYYWFQHDLKRIMEYFGEDVTEFDGSKEHIEQWNNQNIPVMLAHPASAGYGLNLQEGGHILVWFSLPNGNLGLYQQANARLHRQGQKNPVIVHHILTKGTVDTGMLASMGKKERNQERLIDAVKGELDNI